MAKQQNWQLQTSITDNRIDKMWPIAYLLAVVNFLLTMRNLAELSESQNKLPEEGY